MGTKLELADKIEAGLQVGRCFIGFDGMTDEILDVVDTRSSPTDHEAITDMADLGQRIVEAADKSCNFELVVKQRKIGGNGPILANALLHADHRITFVGPLGDKEIEPLFNEMVAQMERVISLGPSSYTQALEFRNGKIMLGKLAPLNAISWKDLLSKLSFKEWTALHEETDLFASGNWTMVAGSNGIWKGIRDQVAPYLTDRERWMYVDLADPAKRSDEDVAEALDLLSDLEGKYRVVLGLNEAEAMRMAQVLGISWGELAPTTTALRKRLNISQVVVHLPLLVLAATKEGLYQQKTMAISHPKLSTGAGDNFNAGYCNGLLKEPLINAA